MTNWYVLYVFFIDMCLVVGIVKTDNEVEQQSYFERELLNRLIFAPRDFMLSA